MRAGSSSTWGRPDDDPSAGPGAAAGGPARRAALLAAPRQRSRQAAWSRGALETCSLARENSTPSTVRRLAGLSHGTPCAIGCGSDATGRAPWSPSYARRWPPGSRLANCERRSRSKPGLRSPHRVGHHRCGPGRADHDAGPRIGEGSGHRGSAGCLPGRAAEIVQVVCLQQEILLLGLSLGDGSAADKRPEQVPGPEPRCAGQGCP